MDHEESIRYNTDSVKYRLIAYKEKERDIENESERLERIETKLYSIGSPVLSDMPKAQNTSHDKMTDLIYQRDELRNEISALLEEQKKEREELNEILKKLRHSDERAVIRMRYFDGATWNDVVDMLFGGKEDFLGKEDTYLRRTHKIHGSALINIAKIIQKVCP